ncbi:MAG: von Willebrand factor type A domain-containing protein [Gammaproteobacteria bacterium]
MHSSPNRQFRRHPWRAVITTLGVAALTACTGTASQSESDADTVESRAEIRLEDAVVLVPAPEPVSPAQRKRIQKAARQAPSLGEVASSGTLLSQVAAMNAFATESEDRERYAKISDHGIKVVSDDPVSTFSIDVDTGAYSNVRRFLTDGALPPGDAVRVEELINYFSYQYELPEAGDGPFSVATQVAATPWNPDTLLMQIGIKGLEIDADERPASNLVFLIDVSGSMHSPDKLPLLKDAFTMLTNNLNDHDRVSLVVYAGASGVVLPPTAGDDAQRIANALAQLRAGGSTNGESGIRLAYQTARDAFIEGGINRVVLATDGDFNVGIANVEHLIDLVERERETGVSLTTLGFGSGNYNDELMERIADAGNGNYAYIDSINEARKVLVDEIGSTLHTIAKDVKIQVEFNPAQIAEYRLIGYENRALNREDFNNDKIDAGEIGAGHTVTALYEITPTDSPAKRVDPLRYGQVAATTDSSDELAYVRLRYKAPGGDTSELIEQPVARAQILAPRDTSADFRFAAAVAAFGQQLRGAKHLERYSFDETLALAGGSLGTDRHGYRDEFLTLVERARDLSAPGQAVNQQAVTR